MTMKANSIGIYIHYPFCLKKCNYCDFVSYTCLDENTKRAYVQKLISEIEAYRGKNIEADTVFFGGGTPSLLEVEDIDRIMDSLHSSFTIHSDAEITIEMNPKTANKAKLLEFRKSGINRLSIGLQSIHENELKLLGRIHNFEDFVYSYEISRQVGFSNVNVDLMYGIPDQTEISFAQSLNKVLSFSPEHLSLYSLIIEPGTPIFNAKDSLRFPNEDQEISMYSYAADSLRRAGYNHYEISNYAKPTFECRHNLKYWRGEHFLGFGVAAYSYFDKKRFGNTRNIHEYISAETAISDEEIISENDEAFEYVMLGLRCSDGFSLNRLKEKYGLIPKIFQTRQFSELESDGYILFDGDRISLTEKGFYVSNTIIELFTEFEKT